MQYHMQQIHQYLYPKQWLLHAFANTTFYIKGHLLVCQELHASANTTFNIKGNLLEMSGKPYKIYLKEGAVPYAADSPIPVP